VESGAGTEIIDVEVLERLPVGEREAAGSDVGHAVQEEIPAKAREVVRLGLEREHPARRPELGGEDRIESDIGAHVEQHVAVAEIIPEPVQSLRLLRRVGLRE